MLYKGKTVVRIPSYDEGGYKQYLQITIEGDIHTGRLIRAIKETILNVYNKNVSKHWVKENCQIIPEDLGLGTIGVEALPAGVDKIRFKGPKHKQRKREFMDRLYIKLQREQDEIDRQRHPDDQAEVVEGTIIPLPSVPNTLEAGQEL